MMAVIHIQKTAPAPPAETAATTPTRFPIPTLVAVGYDERLEGGEAVFAAFRSFQCPEHIWKEPDRKKTGSDGEKDAGWDQKQDQERNTDAAASGERDLDEIAPEKVVDGADYLNDHNISSFL